MAEKKDGGVIFEIKEHIAVLGTDVNGWTKELNIVSWNGNVPKYDIRVWDPDHTRMTRGITLFEKSTERLYDILNDYYEAMDMDITLDDFSERETLHALTITNRNGEHTWDILLPIGNICYRNYSGFTTELNIVSVDGEKPCYDLRNWNIQHDVMTNGISLNDEEMKAMYLALKSIYKNKNFVKEEEYQSTGMTKERAVEIANSFITGDLDNSEYDYVSEKLNGLDITEAEIKELGLNEYLSSLDVIYTTIQFDNNGRPDETQFNTEDVSEVISLWEDFAKENSLEPDSITSGELKNKDIFMSKGDKSYGLFVLELSETINKTDSIKKDSKAVNR